MGKSTHFIGQPILGQLLNFLEKEKIIYWCPLKPEQCDQN